jgi:hypothetical protein
VCAQHEKEVQLLLSQKSKADDEIDRENLQHCSWREKHLNRVATRVAKKRKIGNLLLALLEAREKEKLSLRDEGSDAVKRVDAELGSIHMWFLPGFLSVTKREALERKRIAEVDLLVLDINYIAASNKSRLQRERMNSEAEALNREANSVLSNEIASLQETLAEIKKQRDLIQAKIDDCYRNHAALMDGTELRRIQGEVDVRKSELDDLRTLLDSSEEGDDNSNLQRRRLELLLALKLLALKQLKGGLAGMFCPVHFNEAKDAIQERNDQKESLKTGKEHILRKITVARRIWVAELESDIRCNRRRREDRWSALVEDLERVCTIEENRLLGFPRKGKRCGPMPVYYKRAELQKHLRASQALIVTAGTGCGECGLENDKCPDHIS